MNLVGVAPEPMVCKVALALLSGASRTAIRRAPYPTDDQALAVACKLIDLGLDCDERHVQLGVALLRSRVTIEWIRSYA